MQCSQLSSVSGIYSSWDGKSPTPEEQDFSSTPRATPTLEPSASIVSKPSLQVDNTGFIQASAHDELLVCKDEFKLVKKIGRGTFGIVHLGQYRGTSVAIKEISLACTGVKEDQVKEEILALRRLRHPNIRMIIGYALDDGTLYIITNYVAGDSLWGLLFGKVKHYVLYFLHIYTYAQTVDG